MGTDRFSRCGSFPNSQLQLVGCTVAKATFKIPANVAVGQQIDRRSPFAQQYQRYRIAGS
jgi:hypothetical protein